MNILALEQELEQELPELSGAFESTKKQTILVASLALHRPVSFYEAVTWLSLRVKIRRSQFSNFTHQAC